MAKPALIHADGHCPQEGGPGGYAAILIQQGTKLYVANYEMDATANRMDLQAVIAALRMLAPDQEGTVYTDSDIIINACHNNLLDHWKTTDWKWKPKRRGATRPRREQRNTPLWDELQGLKTTRKVTFRHSNEVKHETDNQLCRSLAIQQYVSAGGRHKKEDQGHTITRMSSQLHKAMPTIVTFAETSKGQLVVVTPYRQADGRAVTLHLREEHDCVIISDSGRTKAMLASLQQRLPGNMAVSQLAGRIARNLPAPQADNQIRIKAHNEKAIGQAIMRLGQTLQTLDAMNQLSSNLESDRAPAKAG